MLPGRIDTKVIQEPMSGCWLWDASLDTHGYGHVKWEGRTKLAHRLIYELLVGNIPKGLDLAHLCEVRSCVNPNHLRPMTRQAHALMDQGCNDPDHARLPRPNVAYAGTYCQTCNKEASKARWQRVRNGVPL